MRCFPLIFVAVALACAACSKEAANAPPSPAEAAVAPAPEAAVQTTPTTVAADEPAIPVARPPPARVVTYVPARERRIHALINNAIARDVTGETEHDAAMWEARRAACRTQACVDRAYAAQETALRKWEGSEAIR